MAKRDVNLNNLNYLKVIRVPFGTSPSYNFNQHIESGVYIFQDYYALNNIVGLPINQPGVMITTAGYLGWPIQTYFVGVGGGIFTRSAKDYNGNSFNDWVRLSTS